MAEAKLVKDIMTSPVHSVTLSVTVKTAMQKMLDYEINALPVVDEEARLLGIVSTLDLVVLAGLDKLQCKLGEVPKELDIKKEVIRVYEDEQIKNALLKIAKHKFGRLAVVNQDNRCIGIVARTDLIRHFLDIEHGLTMGS